MCYAVLVEIVLQGTTMLSEDESTTIAQFRTLSPQQRAEILRALRGVPIAVSSAPRHLNHQLHSRPQLPVAQRVKQLALVSG